MTKEQNAISLSLAERKDLLVLAQQKLDSSNHSFAASNSVRASKKSNAASSLLSTLLYMALMSYKVEDMKAMLKHVDLESYEVSVLHFLPMNLAYNTDIINSSTTILLSRTEFFSLGSN